MEGEGSMSAPSKGIGTKEEEKGVAPEEKGTFGLFVLLTTVVVLLPNSVMNDPAKKRLSAEEFVVMDRTSEEAPDSPPNGGADQVFAFVSQTATAFPGLENEPPTQTLLCGSSQKIAFTSPLGPPLPTALNDPPDGENEATLLAEVPLIDENDPAKNTLSPSAHAVLIFPPASVEPRRVREPSEARDKRVDVVGSNERDVELSNKSSPANVPARPT